MSANATRIYRCPVCDTVVEVLAESGLDLVCCGPSMELVPQRTSDSDAGHQLDLAWSPDGLTVRVGRQAHPMGAAHGIRWIQVTVGDACCRQFLRPGQRAEAHFPIADRAAVVTAYCSLHGLVTSAAQAPDDRLGRLQTQEQAA